MQLDEHEKNLLALAFIGAILGLDKLLADGERVRPRLVMGLVIVARALIYSANVNVAISDADGDVAHEKRPPYYALCFIEYRGI
ncbi:hypothetical protein [Mycetohabitans rhizoxinica]